MIDIRPDPTLLRTALGRLPIALGAVIVGPEGEVHGELPGARITTTFEPLFELANGQVAGAVASALITAMRDDRGGAHAFIGAESVDRVAFDRLRRVVHAVDFALRASPGQSLHLSVDAGFVGAVTEHHGQFFHDVLVSLGLGSMPVVIELPAIAAGHEARIVPVATSYRRHGFGIAFRPVNRRQLQVLVDTVGVDVLRIDAARLARFGTMDPTSMGARRERVALVVDGAGSAFDVELAREAGASHVQGPVFGAPSAMPDLHRPLSMRDGGRRLASSERADVRRLLAMLDSGG